MLNHLAIIMDGNRRWSTKRGLPKILGYKEGIDNAKKIIEDAAIYKIKHLTLFSFSSENWNRSEEEVNELLNLMSSMIESQAIDLHKNNIKIKFIGDIKKFTPEFQAQIKYAEELTINNTRLNLYIALSYSGREEILNAIQNIIKNPPTEINNETFREYLYAPSMPDADLIIRTSGEQRISNFLIWQSAYSELYFSEKLWPDFSNLDLRQALDWFSTRSRRYGSN